MYFVQADKLQKNLKNRNLSDEDAFPYFIFAIILFVPAIACSTILDFTRPELVVYGALFLLLTIIGIYHVYSQNGGAEGFGFIQKFFLLGWVVAFRCLLFYIPMMLFLRVLLRVLVPDTIDQFVQGVERFFVPPDAVPPDAVPPDAVPPDAVPPDFLDRLETALSDTLKTALSNILTAVVSCVIFFQQLGKLIKETTETDEDVAIRDKIVKQLQPIIRDLLDKHTKETTETAKRDV